MRLVNSDWAPKLRVLGLPQYIVWYVSVRTFLVRRRWITRCRLPGWTSTIALIVYSLVVYSAELRALNRTDVTVSRPVRKVIFSLQLLRPVRQSLHSQRACQPAPGRPVTAVECISVCCINTHSAGKKTATLCCTIADDRYDVFVITETWHECSGSTTLKRVTLPGYRCVDAARPIVQDAATNTVDFMNHGGLAIVYHDAVKLRKKNLSISVDLWVPVRPRDDERRSVCAACCVSALQLCPDWAILRRIVDSFRARLVVCGDINIHVDNPDDVSAVHVSELLLQLFGCVQQLSEQPMHNAGHPLDLVITRSDTSVSALRVGDMLSDHAVVRFTSHAKTEHCNTHWVTRRACTCVRFDGVSAVYWVEGTWRHVKCTAASWQGYSINIARSWGCVTRPSKRRRGLTLTVVHPVGPLEQLRSAFNRHTLTWTDLPAIEAENDALCERGEEQQLLA